MAVASPLLARVRLHLSGQHFRVLDLLAGSDKEGLGVQVLFVFGEAVVDGGAGALQPSEEPLGLVA